MQTRSRLMQISLLVLTVFLVSSCAKIYHLADVSEDRYTVSGEKGIPEDQRIKELIAPYKVELEAIMNEQIGTVAETMYKDRPESTLGNWFVDILHEEAQKLTKEKLDFTIQNYGGLRVKAVSSGPLTIGEIYEVMPFENQIVILEARGITVSRLFKHMASKGGWPVSSHIRTKISRSGDIKYLKINGVEIEATETYRFALPDYIANGGDQTDFLDNLKRNDTGVLIRDVVIENLKASGKESIEKAELAKRFIFTN